MIVTKSLHAALAVVALVVTIAVAQQVGGTRPADPPGLAATYEHLASAIIAIRATETSLVRDILTLAFDDAAADLEVAAKTSGPSRRGLLESAAAAVTEIATEGDKRVQAVRQRLLKAGHHHHTDAETEDDYIFIDGREKKDLLDLAGAISRLGDGAEREVLAASRDLRSLFTRAMAEE